MPWTCAPCTRSSASSAPSSLSAAGAGVWLTRTLVQPPTPKVEALAVLVPLWFSAHTQLFMPSPLPLRPFSVLLRRGKFFFSLKNAPYLGAVELSPAPATPSPEHLRERGLQVSAPLSAWPGHKDSPTAGVVYARTKNWKGKSTKCFPPHHRCP